MKNRPRDDLPVKQHCLRKLEKKLTLTWRPEDFCRRQKDNALIKMTDNGNQRKTRGTFSPGKHCSLFQLLLFYNCIDH